MLGGFGRCEKQSVKISSGVALDKDKSECIAQYQDVPPDSLKLAGEFREDIKK
jgi:hypothetical protein